MLKKIKFIIAGLAVACVPILAIGTVSANASQTAVCEGIGLASTNNGCVDDPGSPSVDSTIHTVVTVLSVIVGVLSVIMIIVGGFRYITSGGDSTKVGSAKNTIIYAVIGLVIVALAQVIVRFTISKTSTVNKPTPTVSPVNPQCGVGQSC